MTTRSSFSLDGRRWRWGWKSRMRSWWVALKKFHQKKRSGIFRIGSLDEYKIPIQITIMRNLIVLWLDNVTSHPPTSSFWGVYSTTGEALIFSLFYILSFGYPLKIKKRPPRHKALILPMRELFYLFSRWREGLRKTYFSNSSFWVLFSKRTIYCRIKTWAVLLAPYNHRIF